ncbi:MAG: hypothetical protein ACFFD9_05990 [Candidatus Thorarchaeota archaeon]
MNDVTDRILEALRAVGENGLVIDELKTGLGIDSRNLAKSIKRLKSQRLIKVQKQELKEERYVIRAEFSDEAEPGSLSDMNGCPCFHCLRISKCGVRQPDSPVSCRSLEEWMLGSEAA